MSSREFVRYLVRRIAVWAIVAGLTGLVFAWLASSYPHPIGW